LRILGVVLKSSTTEGVGKAGVSPIKDFCGKIFQLCLLKEVVIADVELTVSYILAKANSLRIQFS